jgi:hypothetical protein
LHFQRGQLASAGYGVGDSDPLPLEAQESLLCDLKISAFSALKRRKLNHTRLRFVPGPDGSPDHDPCRHPRKTLRPA